ncbi:cadmium-translocating P-type ATPase [Mycobacterium koreense]|uniref:Cation-transporting P-type ATPase B n=1 Tax=Mycolicibacillus koreensis TaxID=1069220 RepID=A0A7I7SFC0_9MYCO|nr:heavy metal translocating P-type ATPase [Mycolicibacillus koreensis]MCV7248271.1 cadmium-translocating P-type ATPase [Mycolicibacillus koreensis]ODR09484.1 carbonate dehydratase [Mycolicibacillus koreensis]OSC33792.1 heavy metal translocating P-type ATPase [Mycolicibacillus koreensis]BBY55210.1 putative metal transporter ATPase [Mycolicibacillus koreensis]
MTTTDLTLRGMTCASCAARVERGLNRIDGVQATVNLALERAHVDHDVGVTADQLVAAVQAAGYDAAVVGADPAPVDADVPEDALRPRLIVAAALAVPVVAISMVTAWQFPGWQWLMLALTTPIVAWSGYPFHRAALTSARHGASTMDTLVSLGTLAAYLWSTVVLVTGGTESGGHVYFEVAAAVTAFLLAGRYAEARAKRSAGAALRALLTLGAKDAVVLRDGDEVRIPVEHLGVDDLVVVRPGERIATDGVITEGTSALDTSAMTGESVPVDVGPGAAVLGGALNTYGRVVVRATRVGADTQLARMARLVSDAQSGKASVQRLADRVSAVFVPAVLVIAAATLLGWLAAGGSVAAAFTAAVAVLIIACPCALGLATPTAILVGTGRGAQLGILIKEPRVLENVRHIDTVVLDKTGTVTTGEMTVHDVTASPGEDAATVLAHAAAVEAASEHPLAAAIVSAARERGLDPAAVTEFVNDPGTGVSGLVDGARVSVTRTGTLAGVDLLSPARSGTVVDVAWGDRVRGTITLGDTIKPSSAAAIAELTAMGITPVLLTGDAAAVARRVADEVGIAPAHVIAGVLPTGKADAISALQADGATVAMVGDGVNDSVALATADIGMAMGTGTDVAIEAGDLTLVRGDLRTVPTALRLSARTLRTIRVNLFWAFGYNVAAIPLAALGLLNPMIAGAAMACSSVLVVLNSLRLRRFR